jgi:class 3 adenylate cyclase
LGLAQKFESHRLKILRERFTVALLYMATPLFLAFAFLDYLLVPEFWQHFLMIRTSSALVLLGVGYFLRRLRPENDQVVMPVCHSGTAVLGLAIGYMTYKTGGLESAYYAGLNWVSIGSLAFWPTPWKHRILTIISVYGPLAIFESTLGGNDFGADAILAVTFMAGTVVLSLISNHLSFISIKREFDLREDLHSLILDKDRIIEIKSSESANLKRLAKQFSPTVIEAIESKSLSLDQRNRRKVAIIFLDVVSSTNRVNQLDHNDYQRALDIFFDIAIKRFLADNITVANFMGDGLMAVVNAPNAVTNYELAAFQSCAMILDETRKRGRQLRELWHDEFNIRVGIASGFATVGFFPNSDFGVYTALGDTVNLASRLCSVSEAGSIAVTKPVALAAQDEIKNCEVKKGGTVSGLKGFAGNETEYFLIKSIRSEVETTDENSMCPLCSGNLQVAADMGDSILLKCNSCNYSDIEGKGQTRKLASWTASPKIMHS